MVQASSKRPSRITIAWLSLMALTVLAYGLSRIDGSLQHGITIIIVIVAFVKVRLVSMEYMEIRNSPIILRLFFECWISILGAIIAFTYYAT